MAKFKVIGIDIYKRDITVFIGNHTDFKDWISQYRVPTSWEQLVESIIVSGDNAEASYWYNNSTGNGIIELPYHPKSPKEIAIAAHEVLHSVFHIADYVNLEYIRGGANESFTYLHEYILKHLLDFNDYNIIDYDA